MSPADVLKLIKEKGVKFVDDHGAAALFLELDERGQLREVPTKRWIELAKVN